jgi:hypothetical protein
MRLLLQVEAMVNTGRTTPGKDAATPPVAIRAAQQDGLSINTAPPPVIPSSHAGWPGD